MITMLRHRHTPSWRRPDVGALPRGALRPVLRQRFAVPTRVSCFMYPIRLAPRAACASSRCHPLGLAFTACSFLGEFAGQPLDGRRSRSGTE